MWPIVRSIAREGKTYTYPIDIGEDDARTLWLPARPWRTVVAVEGGSILGMAKYGPNHAGPGDHVANASFMVDPGSARRGVGRALGEHVLAAARADGYRAMQFNAVVETNTAAVALWRSLGFEVLTTIPEAFRHPTLGMVGLHVMHRAL
jgi:ribosomal protein S18 acetylase RimI-like enzyme